MKRAVLTLVALLSTTCALAQQPEVTIKVEKIAPGVAVLFGQGGNIGLSYGEDGNVLIDDQFAPLTPKILAAVATVDPDPVKFLINTHWHGDHTGGNENLGKAGAVIIAHDNVRVRMAGGGVSGAGTSGERKIMPAPAVALPVVTYQDGIKLYVNGDEIRTVYMKAAHTDGDSVVMWKKGNVVHMGDLFMTQGSMPYVDLGSGGNVRGFVAAADKVLAITDAQTRIIPGHGPMATRADLQAWRNLIADVIAKVEVGIKAKKTLAQIQAMKPAARYEKQGTFISGDAFVAATYKSLTTLVAMHKHH